MRPDRSLVILFATMCIASVARGQELDPDFRGSWNLDVAKSRFGGGPAPQSGLVSWTEHGWVYAVLDSEGNLYADAALTDGGSCTLVGVPSSYTCEIVVLTPRHVKLRLFEGKELRRWGDIELVDKNTTRTVHHVIPEKGAPYEEDTIWERARPG